MLPKANTNEISPDQISEFESIRYLDQSMPTKLNFGLIASNESQLNLAFLNQEIPNLYNKQSAVSFLQLNDENSIPLQKLSNVSLKFNETSNLNTSKGFAQSIFSPITPNKQFVYQSLESTENPIILN